MEHQKGEIVIYQNSDENISINVKLEDENIWLSQQQMAELFKSSRTNVVEHIKHIYEEGELDENATCRNFRQVQNEGNRMVERELPYYNLDLIISLGYRIKSRIATQFRIWATQRLKEYIIKGFTMDDERLKNAGGVGLTTFSGIQPTQKDISIAKNYLTENELKILNNLVSGYFDFAEIQAMKQKTMYMKDYIRQLDKILASTDENVLQNAGSVSHEYAVEKALAEYRKYQVKTLSPVEQAYLETIKNTEKQLSETKKHSQSKNH